MIHQDRNQQLIIIASVLTFIIFLTSPLPATPCGWWGDGEASDSDDAIEVDANGNPIVQDVSFPSIKLPGKMGCGIAIISQQRAIPYLQATFRLSQDHPMEFAFHEGSMLGMTEQQEVMLRNRTNDQFPKKGKIHRLNSN